MDAGSDEQPIGNDPARRVTSKDVAEVAGVSRATVSYVLNGRTDKRISAETARRVEDVAQELGYVPDATALALRSGRTRVVLLDMPYWPLGAPTVEGVTNIVSVMESLGYTVLVHFQRDRDGASLTDACRKIRPIGLISSGDFLTENRIAELRSCGVAAFVAMHDKPVRNVPTFVFDQVAVGSAALSHLADRGHRTVLALMPSHGDETRYRAERLRGAEQTAIERSVHLSSIDSTLEPDDMLLRLPAAIHLHRPTAIIAFNDEYARAAEGALHKIGIDIPDDIALLGCDNGPLATLGRRQLSSIFLRSPDRWRSVALALDQAIRGNEVEVPTDSEVRVIQRDTT